MSRLTESCYLQLVPQSHWLDGHPPIGFSVQRVTRNKPSSPLPDAIVVKVNLTVDTEAFEKVPVANITIPLEAVSAVSVEATAG
jgi:hypothetical protein